MKSMLMAVMAIEVAVTFSAPAFAGDEKKKDEKGGKYTETFGDEKKKDEKGGKYTDTFGEEKKKDEKGGK